MQRRLKRTGSLSIIHAAKWNGAASPVAAHWRRGLSLQGTGLRCEVKRNKQKKSSITEHQNQHSVSKQWSLKQTDGTLSKTRAASAF